MRLADDHPGAHRTRLGAALGAFVGVGAVAATLLARAARPAFPISDIAVTEMHVREALAGRVLLGPYSRFGWHHPGPLYFYLLAPFYAAGGAHTAALNAGAAVLSLAAIAVGVWVAARDAGSIVSGTLLAALTLCLLRVNPLVDSAWNAHVIVLPAVTLIALCASVAAGRLAALPLAAAVASFLVQTDVALAPFAAAVALLAAAAGVFVDRADRRGADVRRHLLLTVSTLAVVWALPVAEQLSHRPGNLQALWRFFVAGGGAGQPFGAALAVWSDMVTAPLRPGFALAKGLTVDPAASIPRVAVAVALLVGSAGAAVWARRERFVTLGWFAALSATAAVVTLWSATRIEGPLFDHLCFWFAAVGIAETAAIAAAVATWTIGPAQPLSRATGLTAAIGHGVLLGIVMLIALTQVNAAREGMLPVTESAPSVPNFAASVRGYMQHAGVRKPLFRLDDRQWGLAAGILLELQRDDVPFAVEDDWMPMFPERFRANGGEDAELTIAAVGAQPELAARRGNETVDVSSFVHIEAVRIPPGSRR